MAKEILGSAPMGLPLSPAVAANGFIFLSGQMAFNSENKLVEGDITVQTKQTLDNIKKLLSDISLGMDALIKTTVWLTHVEDYAAFNQAYAEYFPKNPPARSTVRSDLLMPGARIEIESIALKAE